VTQSETGISRHCSQEPNDAKLPVEKLLELIASAPRPSQEELAELSEASARVDNSFRAAQYAI
jgi:hypothetical protein